VNLAALLTPGTLIALFLPYPTYAPTPEQAAKNVVYEAVTAPPVAVRTNIAGRYAFVRISAHEKGGEVLDLPVIVQHFSFGWQAVGFANATCSISARGISSGTAMKLLAGMPKPKTDCFAQRGDSGPAGDIEAVRKIQPFGVVPSVTIAGNYAKADWEGPGGGERIYRRTNGTWKIILGGGGAHTAQDLRAAGVPPDAICKFHISGAKGC